VGLLGGAAALRAVEEGLARPLAGGPLAFTAVEAIGRQGRQLHGLNSLPLEWEERLQRLTRSRPVFAGMSMDRPLLMGILNVTPDSFSDGGVHADAKAAAQHGLALLEAGADLIDVGGESTHPGAEPVPPEEQIRRVEPVIRSLREHGVVLSIDTRDCQVMRAALAAGARIVNDVSALAAAGAIEAVMDAGASAILVHMQGEPETMQRDPHYGDVTLEVADQLAGRIAVCMTAGLAPERLALDPGIGFGKHGAHNAALLDDLAALHGFGAPLVLGASRKGWIGALEAWPPAERLGASIAAEMAALDRGVQILRVHDVGQAHQARLAWRALNGGSRDMPFRDRACYNPWS
jgi:dihydropteroate synthase